MDTNTKFQSLLIGSGLSMNQIARLFGVGVREIHRWKREGVPERQQERAERLYDQCILMYPKTPPESRMRALLSSSEGRSPFHALMDELPKAQQLHFPLPVTFLLGIHDELEDDEKEA